MAWYAELLRRKWYCINHTNMPAIFSKKLYNDWYNSLTDEQKRKIEEHEKAEQAHSREMMRKLLMMTGIVAGFNSGSRDKYHGIYDEYGFPDKEKLAELSEERNE